MAIRSFLSIAAIGSPANNPVSQDDIMALMTAITGWTPDGWIERFQSAVGDIPFIDPRKPYDREKVLWVAAWKPEPGLLATLPNLQAIFNLGAGVDALLVDPTLPNVPIVRIVDENLTRRMTEYVVGHVLAQHRMFDVYAAAQRERIWLTRYQPAASDVRVGIMGMGVLGRDAAEVLVRLGFQVAGWSRRGEPMAGVETFAGSAGFKPFLARTDILICLLPLTPDTRCILNIDLFRALPKSSPLGGPVVINAGRGGHQVAEDVVRALEEGSLRSAVLDVFEVEPLPYDSPLWSHPGITVTPHNAADSDPAHLCRYVLAQIDRLRAGKPLINVVDRKLGY
jgi:glyoxylate/hydroxypyruvate reductase A